MTNDNKEHQKKTVTIIINAKKHEVQKEKLSFDEVVALSGLPHDENTIFTITYSKGHQDKPQGQLVRGDTVPVKEGMIFNVTATSKS
jgi:hypothetical protein